MAELINPNNLKELIAAQAINGADVVGEKGGFVVLLKVGMTERVLAARDKTGQIKRRLFSSLDAVDKYLRKNLHIVTYQVTSEYFEPAQTQPRYLKNAERLKEVHEAAAYDKWFRAQVEQSLQQANDPNTVWLSNEEVVAASAKRRAAWQEQIQAEPINRGTG